MAVVQHLEQTVASLSRGSLIGLVLAALVAILIGKRVNLYQRQRKFAREHGCKPVGAHFPLKDPVFGIDEIFRKTKLFKSHTLLDDIYKNFTRLAPTFGSKVFGITIVATMEPENVKTILSLKFKDFGLGGREKSLGRLLGRGIFTTDGEAWAHSRAMIRPNFTRDQVADLDSFERHIQTLFRLLPRDGSTVDLQEYFFKFTIDSATEFLFGKSTGTLRAQLSGSGEAQGEELFADAFNTAQASVAQRGRMGLLRLVYRDKVGDAAIKICHDFVDQFVEEAVQYRQRIEDLEKKGAVLDEEKYMFLHELAKNTKDKKRLRDELLNVLLAGRDTTASLLSNMWVFISREPEIFAKLRKEVDETLEGRLPTYQELRNMKYLKYCMNECKSYPIQQNDPNLI
jgi:cytochrome P450